MDPAVFGAWTICHLGLMFAEIIPVFDSSTVGVVEMIIVLVVNVSVNLYV